MNGVTNHAAAAAAYICPTVSIATKTTTNSSEPPSLHTRHKTPCVCPPPPPPPSRAPSHAMLQVPAAKATTPGLDATNEYRTPAPNSQPQANIPMSGEEEGGGMIAGGGCIQAHVFCGVCCLLLRVDALWFRTAVPQC